MENQDSELEIESLAGEEKKPGRTGAGIAWLALLLALALAANTGWQWWQERGSGAVATEQAAAIQRLQGELLQQNSRVDALQTRQQELESAGTALARIDAELAGLEARFDQAGSEKGQAREKTRELENTAASLDARLNALEASLAALAVRGESPGKRIELAEIDFLLRNASERLQLFGDRHGAMQAMILADSQLVSLDDPLYLPVRQAIASALLQLDEMPVVDSVELTQALAHLQSKIPALPFPGDAPVTADAVGGSAEESGIWARFKAALSNLVTVRRRVDEQELISIEDKEYVRQGLWLQLESARLALLRADQGIYHASLQRAAATLRQYFDTNAPAVEEALDSLAGLAEAELHVQLPDISAPWSRLNFLRSGTQAAAIEAEFPEEEE